MSSGAKQKAFVSHPFEKLHKLGVGEIVDNEYLVEMSSCRDEQILLILGNKDNSVCK